MRSEAASAAGSGEGFWRVFERSLRAPQRTDRVVGRNRRSARERNVRGRCRQCRNALAPAAAACAAGTTAGMARCLFGLIARRAQAVRFCFRRNCGRITSAFDRLGRRRMRLSRMGKRLRRRSGDKCQKRQCGEDLQAADEHGGGL